jgi:hypothetical protein
MPILSHLLFQPSPAKSSASEPQGMRAPVDHKIVGGFHPPHPQPGDASTSSSEPATRRSVSSLRSNSSGDSCYTSWPPHR